MAQFNSNVSLVMDGVEESIWKAMTELSISGSTISPSVGATASINNVMNWLGTLSAVLGIALPDVGPNTTSGAIGANVSSLVDYLATSEDTLGDDIMQILASVTFSGGSLKAALDRWTTDPTPGVARLALAIKARLSDKAFMNDDVTAFTQLNARDDGISAVNLALVLLRSLRRNGLQTTLPNTIAIMGNPTDASPKLSFFLAEASANQYGITVFDTFLLAPLDISDVIDQSTPPPDPGAAQRAVGRMIDGATATFFGWHQAGALAIVSSGVAGGVRISPLVPGISSQNIPSLVSWQAVVHIEVFTCTNAGGLGGQVSFRVRYAVDGIPANDLILGTSTPGATFGHAEADVSVARIGNIYIDLVANQQDWFIVSFTVDGMSAVNNDSIISLKNLTDADGEQPFDSGTTLANFFTHAKNTPDSVGIYSKANFVKATLWGRHMEAYIEAFQMMVDDMTSIQVGANDAYTTWLNTLNTRFGVTTATADQVLRLPWKPLYTSYPALVLTNYAKILDQAYYMLSVYATMIRIPGMTAARAIQYVLGVSMGDA